MNGRALLAWNLKRLRTERGISQERLAADSGVDRSYVSEIETEKVAVSVDVLDRLAGLLDVRIEEFFRVPEGEPPKSLPKGRKPKSHVG